MSDLIEKTLAELNQREVSRLELIESGELNAEAARACAMIGVINNLLGRDENGVGPLAVLTTDQNIDGYTKTLGFKDTLSVEKEVSKDV